MEPWVRETAGQGVQPQAERPGFDAPPRPLSELSVTEVSRPELTLSDRGLAERSLAGLADRTGLERDAERGLAVLALAEVVRPALLPQPSPDPVRTAQTAARLKQALPLLPRLAHVRRPDPLTDDAARLRLERRVGAHLPAGQVALVITDNRHTMISVRRLGGGRYRARLHHMFLGASSDVVRSLASYIASSSADASAVLGAFIDDHQHDIRRVGRRPREIRLETRGHVYDLQGLFDDLNQRYFGGRIDAVITWGRKSNRRSRRRHSIKMGSYSVEDRLIRIHPALDRPFVPRYFIEWILFHEMLHQVHDIPVVGGRRIFHTPEFLAEERTFPHYERARHWERFNLDRILAD